MPKDFFSIQNTTSIRQLKPGAWIHIIGVAGVAMGQLAMRLKLEGYRVSGSDKDFYEPMGSELRRSGIEIKQGYSANNIVKEIDLVVIGNVVSYGHEEVLQVEQLNIAYTLFPKALAEILIEGKHSIVVSGTHGKSTTTGLIGVSLRNLGLAPSYFVGGVMQDYPESFYVANGKYSVVEGDEYDSAFFAKVPKFTFYKPKTLIVTSVEYDHADIYPSIEVINGEFSRLVDSLPADGIAICCIDGENLAALSELWRKSCKAKLITYGVNTKADYKIIARSMNNGSQTVMVAGPGDESWSFNLSIPSEVNAKNALAGILAAEHAGVARQDFIAALPKFNGVRRRQEVRLKQNGLVLIEDFAHHPTAVKETILGIREFYPGRLWAVFEPRSNTSRKKVFQSDYVSAFSVADKTILCDVAKRSNDTADDLLDVNELSQAITKQGGDSICLPTPAEIKTRLLNQVKPGDVILVMSNGSFGGLIAELVSGLGTRK